MTSAEIMLARKIRSVFEKLIPNKEKVEQKTGNKFFEVVEKVFYRMYQTGKIYWEIGTIVKIISKSKVGDRSREWLEGSFFNSYYTERCKGGRYSFSWIAPLYPWYVPYIAEC